jgi:hypothetical protein
MSRTEQDEQDRTRQAGQDRTSRTGQDRTSRTSRTEQNEQDEQKWAGLMTWILTWLPPLSWRQTSQVPGLYRLTILKISR